MSILNWIGRKARRAVAIVPPLSLAAEIERAVAADLGREPVGTGDWDVVVSSRRHMQNRTILRGVTEEEAKAEVQRWWETWRNDKWGYLGEDGGRASINQYVFSPRVFSVVVCTWGPEAKARRAEYLASLNGKPEPPLTAFGTW